MSEQHLPLFVYGTLRPGASKHKVIQPFIEVGDSLPAKIKGYQMYNFGAFPALVLRPSWRTAIQGDLLRIKLALYDQCLERIDQYEGNGWVFERIMDYVVPENHILTPAWVYIAKTGGLPMDQAKPLLTSNWFEVQRG